MTTPLIITKDVTLSSDIVPYLQKHLETSGLAVLQWQESSEKVETDMLVIASLVGQILGKDMGYHTLVSEGSAQQLETHVEGISNPAGIIPYFALGCIRSSASGGETRIIDGRIAAAKVAADNRLDDVVIEYTSLANPEGRVRYPLVVDDNTYGRVLRYRSAVVTNRVVHSGTLSETEMYALVDAILEESVVECHTWSPGELMFVNNRITLHDRLPFEGHRRMLRVRYNDEINRRIHY